MSLLEAPAKRLTVEECLRMEREGYFVDKPKMELLDGLLIPMSPIGPRHTRVAMQLIEHFALASNRRYLVGPGSPLVLDLWSMPEPDLLLVDPGWWQLERHATPAEVYLVVEVSDSTLQRDRRNKAAAYARQAVREYWIVNLVDSQLEVHRDPRDGKYQQREVFTSGVVAPLAFPDILLQVSEIRW